ncbi:MAG: glycosyltransferase family 1 protein [Citrobacter sp.]|uniref:Glycosyltransferase family 1 protein n=1 Tax=Citrobacter tructae TaxID=2562449 RepID=A0ABX5T1C0_9ENTR|nr:glycosyltransferase family 1 protein [Citrobacter tructae]QBX79313.1 glycosyltransferase family 1 protein [Citrobacter tructae]
MIIIDGIIFSLQKSGGISVYYNELLHRFTGQSEKICHLVYENENSYTSNLIINKKIRWHLEVERFRKVDVFGKENDIFHSSYYRLPSKTYAGKIITTVHDFTENLYPRGLKSIILNAQKRNSILKSDGIICISENTRRDMHKFIPESVNIATRVIYNGVSDFSFNNQYEHFEPYVIFIGARDGYKNFEMCVQALHNLPEIQLIVIGGGQLTDYELKLLNENIPNRYKHAGFISECELESYYQNALALVYPSFYEGFGIPVIEAMKCGCPVIASKSSSVQEIAGNAAVLIENITAEKIGLNILKLKSPAIRTQIITLGLNNAKKFSWDKMASETLDFYNYVRGEK